MQKGKKKLPLKKAGTMCVKSFNTFLHSKKFLAK